MGPKESLVSKPSSLPHLRVLGVWVPKLPRFSSPSIKSQNLPPASTWTPTWRAVAPSSMHRYLCGFPFVHVTHHEEALADLSRPTWAVCPLAVSHFWWASRLLANHEKRWRSPFGRDPGDRAVPPASGAATSQSRDGSDREEPGNSRGPRYLAWHPRNQPSGLSCSSWP